MGYTSKNISVITGRAATLFLNRRLITQLIVISLIIGVFSLYHVVSFTQGLADRVVLSRRILLWIIGHALLLIFLYKDEVIENIISFFKEKSHPVNLAIFRLVVFWTLIHSTADTQEAYYLIKNAQLFLQLPYGWG